MEREGEALLGCDVEDGLGMAAAVGRHDGEGGGNVERTLTGLKGTVSFASQPEDTRIWVWMFDAR